MIFTEGEKNNNKKYNLKTLAFTHTSWSFNKDRPDQESTFHFIFIKTLYNYTYLVNKNNHT